MGSIQGRCASVIAAESHATSRPCTSFTVPTNDRDDKSLNANAWRYTSLSYNPNRRMSIIALPGGRSHGVLKNLLKNLLAIVPQASNAQTHTSIAQTQASKDD